MPAQMSKFALVFSAFAVVWGALLRRSTYATNDSLFFSFNPCKNLVSYPAHSLDDFTVYAAPASGPRGFVTMGFDHQFVHLARSGLIAGSKWFVGGSTAAMRFCAIVSSLLSGSDNISAIKDHFIEMTYRSGDTPSVLSPMMEAMFTKCAPTELLEAIINHPTYHLAIMVTAMSVHYSNYPDWQLKLVFLWCFLINLVAPALLRKYFRRICFYSGSTPPPFLQGDRMVEFAQLTSDNIYAVLRATTCIPFVSERISSIPGTPSGLFYDGAVSHYHYNLLVKDSKYQVLYLGDAYGKGVKQTFFDAFLPWRSAPRQLFDNVSIVSPTALFVRSTPEKRLPNVSDWFRRLYVRRPEVRKRTWRAVYDLATQMWSAEKPVGN